MNKIQGTIEADTLQGTKNPRLADSPYDGMITPELCLVVFGKYPKGIKINPATSINSGSNKIDSIAFSLENLARKILYLDKKCHIPPGIYLYMFVFKNIFTIFKLLLLQPILFIKSFQA